MGDDGDGCVCVLDHRMGNVDDVRTHGTAPNTAADDHQICRGGRIQHLLRGRADDGLLDDVHRRELLPPWTQQVTECLRPSSFHVQLDARIEGRRVAEAKRQAAPQPCTLTDLMARRLTGENTISWRHLTPRDENPTPG